MRSTKKESVSGTARSPAPTSASNQNKLEVTVIPVDDEPYSKTIVIPANLLGTSTQYTTSGINGSASIHSSTTTSSTVQNQYPSLKDIFQSKENLWKNIFGNYVSQNKQPLFSIFRKKITIKSDSKIPHPQGEDIGLHILFLKCDGNRFPRNAYANQLEVYCSTYFYGPLVIVYGELSPPYKLHSFSTSFLMDRIQPLNEEEQKIYPLPFSAKKCATVRNLMADTKFSQDLDQYEKSMSLWEFMIYSYKTSFCPFINKKHEWSECNYAHRQQDFRRPPHIYLYYQEKCQHVTDDGTWDECPEYLECQYSHTLVEQLFSPLNYKLRRCSDATPEQKFQCKKRLDLCSNNHSQDEKNLAIKALYNPPDILPEHESMQDYIDIIDQEGLLNSEGNSKNGGSSQSGEDSEKEQIDSSKNNQPKSQSPPETSSILSPGITNNNTVNKSAGPKTQTTIQKPKMNVESIIKISEDNTDGWKQLEKQMNKQSSSKLGGSETIQKSISPQATAIMEKSPIDIQFNPPIEKKIVPIPEFEALDDDDFPIQKKKAQQLLSEKPKEPDYIQEMMKANNPKNSAIFGATGTTSVQQASKTDPKLTVIKSERKNRKKNKKSMKVQEVQDMGQMNQNSDDRLLNDANDNYMSNAHDNMHDQNDEYDQIGIEYCDSQRSEDGNQMEFTDSLQVKNSTKRSTSKLSGQSQDQDNQSAGYGLTRSEQLSMINSNINRQLQNDEKSSGNNNSNNDPRTNPELIEDEIAKSEDDQKNQNTLFSNSILNDQAYMPQSDQASPHVDDRTPNVNEEYLSVPSSKSGKHHRKTNEETKKFEGDLVNVKKLLETSILDTFNSKQSDKSPLLNSNQHFQEASNSPVKARYVKKGTLHQYQVKQTDPKLKQTTSSLMSSLLSSPVKRNQEQEILKMTTKYKEQSRFCQLDSSSSSGSSRNNSAKNDNYQSILNKSLNFNNNTANSNQDSHSSHIQSTTGTTHKPLPLKSNLAKQNYNR